MKISKLIEFLQFVKENNTEEDPDVKVIVKDELKYHVLDIEHFTITENDKPFIICSQDIPLAFDFNLKMMI